MFNDEPTPGRHLEHHYDETVVLTTDVKSHTVFILTVSTDKDSLRYNVWRFEYEGYVSNFVHHIGGFDMFDWAMTLYTITSQKELAGV